MMEFRLRQWTTLLSILLVALVSIAMGDEASRIPNQIDAIDDTTQRLDSDIRFFASEELKGRGVGTDGIDQAAAHIADRFASLGLKTELFDGTPFQPLKIATGIQIGEPVKNKIQITQSAGKTIDLALGESFNPLALGSSGAASGEVVFVGYGISAPNVGFDEYSSIDARNRIVMLLRKEPRLGQQNNPLGNRSPTPSAYFSTKILNAIAHGATGILIVNDRDSAEKMEQENAKRDGDPAVGEHAILRVNQAGNGTKGKRIPAASISRSMANKLIVNSLGQTLKEIEQSIDDSFQPRSSLLKCKAHISTDLVSSDVIAKNVIGELPGTGPMAKETVIVGAHYDHVGMGGIGSLAPGTIAVHNGADDNASGTASLLEIARNLSQTEAENRRRIVFIAFTAEERGLLGSAHYVRNPRFDLEETVAMINLDMVGRLKGNFLSVYGTGTANQFDRLIDQTNIKFGFRLDKDPSGYGPSDHQSFYEKNIPVLHFFTGLHNDYHRPSDDFDKINLSGLTRITDMVTEVARQIATAPAKPIYQSTSRGKGIRTQKAAYLGVQLRMTNNLLTVSNVVSQGPAEKSGLLAGDALLRVEKKELSSIQDMLDDLATRAGGDTISLEVRRGQQELNLQVILGER